MNETLLGNIEDIFAEINGYIFLKEKVDLEHVYIDGTKIPANAYKYGWVWKKSCLKNRNKTFEKITMRKLKHWELNSVLGQNMP